MNALARVWAAIRGGEISPESPKYSSPMWWGQFGNIPGGLVLNTDQQMAVSVAWACIRAIVDPIAASDLKVYEEDDGKRTEDRKSWLYWLLNVAPHPQYTSQGWTEVMLTRAVAKGNSYAHIRRDGMQKPFSLQPLDPDRMRADEERGSILYVYQDPANGEVLLPDADVIHVPGPRTGGFYGDSPLARASASLALAKAQEEYATAYYANGAYPGVLLKPPPANMTPLTEAQKKGMRAAWTALFGGPRKRGGVGALDPGWDVQIIQTDAEKSAMVEARRWQVSEIARYFGVPGHLVGVPEASQGYGKNLAELGLGFVRQTLEPWSRRISEELRRKLMPARRQSKSWFMEYDLTRLTKGDEESVARAEEIALRTGVLTINEARAMRGLPSVDGGDVTLVNGKPLEDVIDPPEPPEPKAAPGMDAGGDGEDMMDDAPVADALRRHAAAFKSKRTPQAAERLRMDTRARLRSFDAARVAAALASVEAGVEPEKAAAHLLAPAR